MLGKHQQILCAQYDPDKLFQKFHEEAGILLAENTDYRFDTTHQQYIPHTKIQTIRQFTPENKIQELTNEYLNRNYRKLDFKVKTLALMQREKKHFEIVHRYPLAHI